MYIKDGRLRALAVKTAKRSEALPDLPTVGEFVPDAPAVKREAEEDWGK